MIDFILCSPELANYYVSGSYRIHPGSVAAIGSDHNPVSAAFRLRD
jgi:endonuclease/exonuclease/phosphatase family metal-dependent hydrolase